MTASQARATAGAARDRLIVALDTPALAEAEALVVRLAGVVPHFKVGSPLFTAAGPAAVEMVHRRGGRVFLDLKYHDIPAAVAGGCPVRGAARCRPPHRPRLGRDGHAARGGRSRGRGRA